MRNFFRIAAIMACTAMGAGVSAAQDGTIRMGGMVWEDLNPISLIIRKFLEHQGYTVELVGFSEWGISFGALTRGDVDILASQINYVTEDYRARNHMRLEKVSALSHGLDQGVVVPSYMDVDSIDQLNSVRDQVDGRIIGIEPVSGLMRNVANAVDEYALDYEIIDGSTAAMIAALSFALEREEPIVAMLREPSWMAGAFDVKFFADPNGTMRPRRPITGLQARGFRLKTPLSARRWPAFSSLSRISPGSVPT